jgi:hypothetical protein
MTLSKKIASLIAVTIFCIVIVACKKKSSNDGPPYDTPNSLTLFKPGNANTKLDLTLADTILSQAGLTLKNLQISGATGSSVGLKEIKIELRLASNDSLINSKTITQFVRPDYHVLNAETIDIPKAMRGNVYRICVSSTDQSGALVGKKCFHGVDVLSCDPLPTCVVPNQITILLETPTTTLANDNIYLFGSINGYANTDVTYKFNKNPDLANCYCISVPFPSGSAAWQLGELFVTRGSWGTNAVSLDGTQTYSANYNTGDLGGIYKMKVPKWRDR